MSALLQQQLQHAGAWAKVNITLAEGGWSVWFSDAAHAELTSSFIVAAIEVMPIAGRSAGVKVAARQLAQRVATTADRPKDEQTTATRKERDGPGEG